MVHGRTKGDKSNLRYTPQTTKYLQYVHAACVHTYTSAQGFSVSTPIVGPTTL